MKKLLLSMAALPLVIGGLSVSASADDGINILNDVKLNAQIRPRYEYVNVDAPAATDKTAANAFTVRTHLVVSAGLFDVPNLTVTLGLQSVNNFGSDKYDSGTTAQGGNNKSAEYDTVLDAQHAMLSEASIDYKINKTALHAGRSQVNLDNQRFIGTVGWRQNERSYDTAYVADNSVENLNLLVAYVWGFQGVTATPTTDTNTVLLHADYKVMDELSITAYDYMLSNIHDTAGIALTGEINLSVAKLDYRAEYASQSDATMDRQSLNDTNGTVGVAGTKGQADATYMNFDLGANISGILVGVNYEVLSGTNGTDGKTAFSTPLATGHKFNGWADKFLATPSGGLKDANIRLGYTAKGLGKILAVYHDFKADENMAMVGGTTDDLGSEIDVVYTNKIPGVNNLTGILKYASYSKGEATGYTVDVTKAWVGLDYKFATK
jgi:hypothetical protein